MKSILSCGASTSKDGIVAITCGRDLENITVNGKAIIFATAQDAVHEKKSRLDEVGIGHCWASGKNSTCMANGIVIRNNETMAAITCPDISKITINGRKVLYVT